MTCRRGSQHADLNGLQLEALQARQATAVQDDAQTAALEADIKKLTKVGFTCCSR